MKHEELEHSPHGPSSFSRLEICAGSYAAIQAAKECGDIPEVEPSKPYNEQGQREHDACYAITTSRNWDEMAKRVYSSILRGNQDAIERVEFAILTVKSLLDMITLTSVMDEPQVYYEVGVNPKDFIRKCFVPEEAEELIARLPAHSLAGTADIVIYDVENNVIYIIDYKFGYIEVEAEDNGQLLSYALGAVGQFCKVPPARIKTMVIQPQAKEKICRAEYSMTDLINFARDRYVPVIEKTIPTEDYIPACVPSADCSSLFCELDGHCKAQHAEAKRAFKQVAIDEIGSLNDEELARVANSAPMIKRWVAAVEKACTSRQLSGRDIYGRKLIRKTKHRVWKDPIKTLQFLARRGVKKEDREIAKPVSPAQAERLLKDNATMSVRTWNAFAKLWEKPEGELISVPWEAAGDPVDLSAEIKQAFKEESQANDIDDIDDFI